MAKVLDVTDPYRPVPYKRSALALMESAIEWIDHSHFRRKIAKAQLSKRVVSFTKYIPFELPPDGFDSVIGAKVVGIKKQRVYAAMEFSEHIDRTKSDKRRLQPALMSKEEFLQLA